MINSDYNNHYIPVKIGPGMFSSEFSVEIKLIDGKIISLFADKCLIKEFDGVPMLKVCLIKSEDDRKTVLLPSEAFETGSRWAELENAKEIPPKAPEPHNISDNQNEMIYV